MRQTLPTAIILLLVPAGSWAQLGNAPGTSMMGPTAFGSGVQPQLTYAGTVAPSNLISFSLSTETGYDSNIGNLGEQPVGGAFLSLGPNIGVTRQGEHLAIDLDYNPRYLFYPGHEQYDNLNQALTLGVSYRFTPRVTLEVRDSFSSQSGNFQPGLSNPSSSVPGLGPPTTLNQTVYTGFVSQQNNAVRVDAIYQMSSRTSFTLFGGYDQLHFTGQPTNGQQLFNTRGTSGGLQYGYRLSEHTTLGVLYLYQNFSFEGSQSVIGAQSRITTHSVLASFAWRLSPSVALSVFGGPQYIPSEEYFVPSPTLPGSGVTVANPLFRSQWNEAAGGRLTKQGEKTAFNLIAQRTVTNGGGLLTAVTSSTVGVGARRKLLRGWDASLNVTYALTDGLTLPSLPRNNLSSETATFALDHPLSQTMTARFSYTFTHQSNPALLPVAATFDRSRVSLSFTYRAKSIPLSH
jgi:hypothetical protein